MHDGRSMANGERVFRRSKIHASQSAAQFNSGRLIPTTDDSVRQQATHSTNRRMVSRTDEWFNQPATYSFNEQAAHSANGQATHAANERGTHSANGQATHSFTGRLIPSTRERLRPPTSERLIPPTGDSFHQRANHSANGRLIPLTGDSFLQRATHSANGMAIPPALPGRHWSQRIFFISRTDHLCHLNMSVYSIKPTEYKYSTPASDTNSLHKRLLHSTARVIPHTFLHGCLSGTLPRLGTVRICRSVVCSRRAMERACISYVVLNSGFTVEGASGNDTGMARVVDEGGPG